MRYELDENGYISKVFFGCKSGTCTLYEGETPTGYETLEEWSTTANIRAYNLVGGNLTYDADRDTSLKNQYLNEKHKILWSGVKFMHGTQEIVLNDSISNQPNGIVLAWGGYENESYGNYNWNYTFVPKQHVVNEAGGGVACHMSGACFADLACKYVYVSDNSIKGDARNDDVGSTNSISYANNKFVLRYVYGV